MSLYSEVDTEEYYDSIAKVLLKKKGTGKRALVFIKMYISN
jgi:hypothetical protein